MKTKFKNKLRYVAAGIFLLGLIANVSLSLTDPFVHVGADLLAQASSSSSSSGTSGTGQVELCSATVSCSPHPLPASVSCKGYDRRFSCIANQLQLFVECDGNRSYCQVLR